MSGQLGIIWLVFIVGIFYFMIIRPQKKRMNQHKALMNSIEIGDEVISSGGIFGIVKSMGDTELQIEVSPGTIIRIARSAVGSKVSKETGTKDEKEEKTETKA